MISQATATARAARREAAPADLRAAARAFERAAARSRPGAEADFPEAGFALLRDCGLHAPAVGTAWGGLPDPGGGAGLADLLFLLRALGRADLSLGRLYEGHLNALQLVGLFGTPAQRARVARDLAAGLIFAVWNSDGREPLRLAAGRLQGGKAFASGAGRVERPLVTATLEDGRRQMLLLDDRQRGAAVDPQSWQPLGMAASCSFAIDFSGLEVFPDQRLGAPDDYHHEPWFSAGALRFAAVQLGGAERLLELTREHLRQRRRAGDPHQIARVAEMAIALESGVLWLERAAALADRWTPGAEDGELALQVVAYAHMARSTTLRICLDIQEAAIRSVGAAGLLRPHPMEQLVRDLTLYLRQPAPDAALAAIGHHVLASDLPLPELWATDG